MVTVATQSNIFGSWNGHNITAWSSNEALYQYLKELKEGEQGWIKIQFPDGYVSNTHFRVKEDGIPSITNASLGSTYCNLLVQQCGMQVAELLCGDRLELSLKTLVDPQ